MKLQVNRQTLDVGADASTPLRFAAGGREAWLCVVPNAAARGRP